MALNKEKIYQDTPGKENVIHFNNAGAALMPQCVIDAQIAHINLEANISGFSFLKS